MDTEAKVVSGRTYVPIRFITQGLGSQISYDNRTKKVGIKKNAEIQPNVPVLDETAYKLELSKWGVYNDGTHAIETTKGINEAMKWAKSNGYKTTYIPAGTYLISKGTKEEDKSDTASIHLVSDMKLLLDQETVFKKETNGFEGYSVISVLPGTKNASVEGGTLVGDRETHDYSAKTLGGTHEWGMGINIRGGENIAIDKVKIQKMTGDGIYVGMSPVWGAWEAKDGGTPKSTIEQGGVDDNGNLIEAPGKIRNIGMLEIREDTPEKYRMINVWIPQGLSSSKFDVFYYDKNNNFISKDTGITNAKYSKAPADARYYRLVFSAPKLEGVYALMYHLDIANNVVIKNNDIGYNRRQGITANGEDVQILNNYIHHTKGTSPQSGIDIEPGFATAYNHTIKGNTFEDNVIQMVVSKGENLLVEGNTFKSTTTNGVGFHVHPNYKDVKIINNVFEGRGMGITNTGTIADGNIFKNGATANMSGYNYVFNNGKFYDAELSLGGNGSATDNEIFTTGNNPNQKGIFDVSGTVKVKNAFLKGTQSHPVLVEGKKEAKSSTYENFTIVNGATGTSLPSGTYFQPNFTYTGQGTQGISIQHGGNVTIDGGKFKNVTLMFHSIAPEGELIVKNSIFEFDGELSQPALTAADGKLFKALNNTFIAKNATNINIPILSISRENDSIYLHSGMVDGNTFHTKSGVTAVDTIKSRISAPSYNVSNNVIYNGKINLLEKDIHTNNSFLTE